MQRSKKMTFLLSASFLESVSQLRKLFCLLSGHSLRDLCTNIALYEAF